jgi:hypothetical protein
MGLTHVRFGMKGAPRSLFLSAANAMRRGAARPGGVARHRDEGDNAEAKATPTDATLTNQRD